MAIRNTRERVLDATRECIVEFGVRRTTLTEIARRAGVSRPTLYRHYGDLRAILRDLITRELVGLLPSDAGDGPVGPRLVELLVATAARMREDPLVRRIMDVDPEVLVPYVFERLGSSQVTILAALEQLIAAGHADGSIRPGSPSEQSAMLLLIVQSAVQSARIVADRLPAAALDRELATALAGYLEVQP